MNGWTWSRLAARALMDATPLTAGPEWSGWAHQLRDALDRLSASEAGLFELAAGGTAVGTGRNAPPGFGRVIAEKLAELTGHPFVTTPNKFAAQGRSTRWSPRLRQCAGSRSR